MQSTRLLSSAVSAGLRRRKPAKPITDGVSSFLSESSISKFAIKRSQIEKTMGRRCAVMHLLAKKGIWDGRIPKLDSVLKITERNFKERFVDRYVRDLPKLKERYEGKLNPADFA